MPVLFLGIDARGIKSGAAQAKDALGGVSQATETLDKKTASLSKTFDSAFSRTKGNVQQLRSLAQQLVAVYSAYKSLSALGSTLKLGVSTNQEWEESKLSIASVIAATNTLSDSQGKVLEGTEKFTAAQELAAQMMERIQVLGLQTTATTQDLVNGVQGIIAPASRVGIELEKIPDLAVNIAQAMGSMKIPLEQMRTEAEALLSGNINRAQDILATNLGITGEMVRNWQKQGTLLQEINARLESFRLSGEAIADTWTGLTSNLEEYIQFISRGAGEGLFENLKQAVREIQKTLVTTNAKTGYAEISGDVKNLVAAYKELNNFIGERLLSATRSFLNALKELNDPEQLNQLKETLSNIWDTAGDIGSRLTSIIGLIGDVAVKAADGWNRLPEPIREVGLIAAILAGRKGVLVLGGLSYLYSYFSDSIQAISLVQAGIIEIQDVMFKNGEELAEYLDNLREHPEKLYEKEVELNKAIIETEQQLKSISDYGNPFMGVYSGADALQYRLSSLKSQLSTLREFLGTNKKAVQIEETGGTPYIPKKEIKNKPNIGNNKALTESQKNRIESARRALEGYRAEIERLKGSGDDFGINLNKKLVEIAKNAKNAGLSMSEMKALQDEYSQAAIAKHYEDIAKAIQDVDLQIANMRGDTAKAQMMELSRQSEELRKRLIALGEAPDRVAAKVEEFRKAFNLQSQIKDAQAAADFYKELAELSGDYGRSQEYTNTLLALQADNLVRNVGITRELADEWLRLQKIQNSQEAWAGAYRATQQYFSEATNLAQGFEGLTTNAFSSMEDAIVEFASTGKLSFSDMVNSMISDLIRLTVRANITGPLAGALGSGLTSLFALGGGTATASVTGNSISSGWANAFVNRKFATGGAFFGGNLSSYRNSIVSSPTFFTHDRHISRYAKGAGLMGEAGPEAIMPLVRTSGGNLGVRAEGVGTSPQINIQVINQTGTDATAEVQQQRNAQGGMDVVVLLKREMASDIARGGVLDQTIRGRYGVKPVVRGR